MLKAKETKEKPNLDGKSIRFKREKTEIENLKTIFFLDSLVNNGYYHRKIKFENESKRKEKIFFFNKNVASKKRIQRQMQNELKM